jgi:hypothetical protein
MAAQELSEQIEEHRALCHAAGCTSGFLTKEDLKDLKPSLLAEIAKGVIPTIASVGLYMVLFYGQFKALEAKVEMLVSMVKVVVK